MRGPLFLALGIGLGVATTMILRGPTPAPARPAAAERTSGAGAPAVRCVASVDEDQLRAILRSELGGLRGGPAPERVQAPEPPVRDEAAVMAAGNAVDQAIGRGVWTDEDREAFHRSRSELTSEEVSGLTARLVTAVNEQRLQLATSGPAF